jgi:ribosome-associated protein
MLDDLPIDARLTLPGACLSFHAVRSSGPGGQNVNKVATKVDLRFDLEGCAALTNTVKTRLRALAGASIDAEGRVVIVSEATRSQPRNLEDAREKLAALVRRALVTPKTRKPTKPTKGSRRRRVEDKRRQSEKKRDRGRFRGDE